MSFLSFLKKAFNPFTPMTAAMNINKQIKAGGIKGLADPLAPFKNTFAGLQQTATSTNDPNPYSLGRDVVTGLGQQGIKGMFNPLSSLKGLQLAGQSLTGGGQNPQEQAAAGANMINSMGQLQGGQQAMQQLQGGGGFNPNRAAINPQGGGGFAGGGRFAGVGAGGPAVAQSMQGGGFMGGVQRPQQGAQQQQPLDANARLKIWREQGIRV